MVAMIPLWLKLGFTAMTVVVLVAYWFRYGPINYLWFSNIALVGATVALWLESALLASTMAVLVLVPELVWALVLAVRLLSGWQLGGMLGYMFDRERPLWLRLLSLYHLPLPAVLVWMVWGLGYDARALPLAMAICWIILPLSWYLAPLERNINWVHGLFVEDQPARPIHPLLHLLLLMICMPLLFHLPAHWLLGPIFPAAG